ncbi:Dizzy [Strongyloides ratti]|uniref:Dizzy n=1 Tax=Strongyloides ratti TaxID=34506 RepID=A0A090KPR3_STRRB|nr:Dizzy [Strongyloides ratti]CEF59374.1 Dizzy [Strongyloides ratti]
MYRFTPDFKNALIKNPKERTKNDIDIIFSHLKQLEGFKWINDTALRKISRAARYEAYPMNHILFRKGQPATCWYILLTGSVYIDEQIQLPLGCFGKRNEVHLRRISDCIILQPSELIVIDYPDDQRVPIYQSIQENTNNIYNLQNNFQTNLQIKGTRFGDQLDTPYFDNKQVQSSTLRPKQIPIYEMTTEKGNIFNGIDNTDCNVIPTSTTGISRITVQSSQTNKFTINNKQISRVYNNLPEVSNCPPIPVKTTNLQQKNDIPILDSPTIPYHHIFKNQPQPYVRYRTHNSQLQRKSLDETAMQVNNEKNMKNNVNSSIKQPTYITVGGSSSSSRNDELSGLPEAFVDSDDEEGSCPSHDSFQELRDNVRECLEKEPSMRTLDDILILLDFMSQMQAFANLPMSIRKQICLKMLFAVVQDSGTVILQHGDKLDSWSVVVNGYVEWTKPNGEKIEYRMGDAFGATASPTEQYHEGEMRTMTNNCEFLLVEHKDFYHIMSTINQHIEKVSDVTGEVVSETERRVTGNQVGLVIIKAKPEKLLQLLVEESDTISDEHYTEDYLLMYRVFLSDPTEIFLKLKQWFDEPTFKEKIPRIVLLWVNSHFNDFESNCKMIKLLEEFGNSLEKENLHSQLALLNIACSIKSKIRTVILTRSNRDQELCFSLIGGKEINHKLFIADISNNCDSQTNELRRGDEILEVNGHNFSSITLSKALVLLKDSTHLSIQVKWNLMGFKEMLIDMESKKNNFDYDSISSNENPFTSIRYEKNDGSGIYLPSRQHNSSSSSVNTKMSHISSKNSMMSKLINIIKGTSSGSDSGFSNDLPNNSNIMNTSAINSSLPPLSGTIRASRSNPDIHINIHRPASGYKYSLASDPFDNTKSNTMNQIEEVIKVYRSDQTFRYLIIYPHTTVSDIVKLALQEFGMNTDTGNLEWSLCMTSVTPEGAIKQRTLPQTMKNMGNYLNLNSRYYLKNNDRSEPLLPDDVAPEVLKESQTYLIDLNAHTIAVHLTLQDFGIFSKIETTEYVDCLFEIKSSYGWPMLKKFEDIFNVEMWWVATEICSEKIVYKRAKLIKKFIKVARHCRELRNFNSMFAIISGLEKPAVRRLQNSWERVPNKYVKMLNDMQTLLDPSRNMSKYRQHLLNLSQDPPVIPIYPVFKKDLIYSNEANETYSDKLVNFEKLRIIAKIIRSVTKLSLVPYTQEVILNRDSSNMDSKSNTSTIKKLSGSKNGSQSRKKMYEQDQMVKKVKAYLEVMKICDNENELDKMSSECEPPQNSSSGNASSGTSRKRAPSPSSSSISSHSNQSEQFTRFHTPKFGVESPQAVQKMLSLVQNSKVKPAINVKGFSPIQSPMLNNNRGTPKRSNTGIGRIPSFSSRSSSNSTDLHPVDLTAESSSVTTFCSTTNTSQNSNSTDIGPGAFVRPIRRK